MTSTDSAPTTRTDVPTATVPVVVGAVAGLAWAAGFRGWMVELAGPASQVNWDTFAAILAPGLLTGAALGWALHLRRTGGHPRVRWLAAAPLLFAIAPMLLPGGFVTLVTTGAGSGASWVALIGLTGGYALAGRGRRWTRALAGAVAAVLAVGLVPIATDVGGPRLALDTPRGIWVAVLGVSFAAVLAIASAIPHRPAA